MTLFRKASDAHQAGELRKAERLYRKVLAKTPRDFDALVSLGLLLGQGGRAAEAAEAFSRACEISPFAADAHYNLAFALQCLQRPEAAIRAYDQALAIEPGFVKALVGRADCHAASHDLAAALIDYDRALTLEPCCLPALNNKGLALLALRRPKAALTVFESALKTASYFLPARLNRARALMLLGRRTESLTGCEQAIALDARSAEAHKLRASILREAQRPKEALSAFETALRLDPSDAETCCNYGALLHETGRLEDAETWLRKAITLDPHAALAYTNLGGLLRDTGRAEESVAACDRAISLSGTADAAHLNRAVALTDLGRFDEALNALERAESLGTSASETRFRASLIQLLRGELKDGFNAYEHRKGLPGHSSFRTYGVPALTAGMDVQSKTVFCYFEQGLGDTIQFARYLPLLAERGARVIAEVQKPIRKLISTVGDKIEFVESAPANFDCHTPLLSLPQVFGTTVETIPNRVPYLTADPGRVRHWRDVIGEEGFRIGISWQGSVNKIDVGRSVPLQWFLPLSDENGVQLFSLQKNAGSDQLAATPGAERIKRFGAGFDAGDDALLDTAAIMMSLDLIITVDTSIAHLAGALGRPTWVPLKFVPDWRWMLARDDSPWYPTMRLFRQSGYGDWESAFGAVRSALKQKLEEQA